MWGAMTLLGAPAAAVACALAVAGCEASEAAPPGATEAHMSDAAGTEAGADGSSGGSGAGPTSGASGPPPNTTGAAETGVGTPPTPPPPPPPIFCGLRDIDPSIDPTTVLESGDEEGLIPTEIGDALIRNCGCHYTEEVLPPLVDYQSNTVPIATLADFHVPFRGVLPMDFEGPVYLAVYERVVNQVPLPMPSPMCSAVEGDDVITEADKALFEAWLSAGAPDGASWPVRE